MNRFYRILIMAAAILSADVATAQPQGFSYQAVVRNAQGELVCNSNVGLRLTIADSTGSQIMYSETQTVQTNAYGVLSVTVGSGKSDAKRLQDVNWASDNVWLHVEVDVTGGTNYTGLGATKIQAVPVALYAARSGSNSQTASPSTANTSSTDALFEVKDKDGNVIFAVYPDGVRVYVDDNDGSKAARSGFLITGRTATKDGQPKDYFVVNGEGTQVYVDDDPDSYRDKAARSGFLITGRTATKGENADLLSVDGNGTKVFIDDNNKEGKAARSGFLVTGRTATKDSHGDYLKVATDGTQVYFDNADTKAARSGFLVTGRTATKGESTYLDVATDGTQVNFDDNADKAARSGFLVTGRTATKEEPTNYLDVSTTSTQVHFDGGNSKAARSGFLITGRTATKGSANEYFNIDAAQGAKVINEENRVYWYPEKNAFMAGKLKVESPDSVGTNSFTAGSLNKAIGNYSQAMGIESRAKGNYTTAIGKNANADKDNAYAFGNNAQAIGAGSYAIGAEAYASGMSSFAIGSVGQDKTGRPLPSAQATADYAYAIGAGTVSSEKGAFAIGVKTKASGLYSTAIGYDTKASGAWSTAMGFGTKSSSEYSTAMGELTTASGFSTTAMGRSTIASGRASTAMGYITTASGENSIAMGNCTTASGDASVATGFMTTASGIQSTAMGEETYAKSYCETAIGLYSTDYTPESTTAWGTDDRLFVIGNGTRHSKRSDALIIYKTGNAEFRGNLYPAVTEYDWQREMPTYTLGTSENRWDTVYANVINASNGTIQTSDQRLKTNIKPLERALDKVLTLNGVTYEWRVKEFPNKNFDSNRHVGVLAQELEAVLPEAVETGEDGYKSVNYSNITPLLIEAIKELKAEKDAQQAVIDAQNKKIEALEAQMQQILEKMK